MSTLTPLQKAMQTAPMNDIPTWGYESPGQAGKQGDSAIRVTFDYADADKALQVYMKAEENGSQQVVSGTLSYDYTDKGHGVEVFATGKLTVTDSSSPKGREVDYSLTYVKGPIVAALVSPAEGGALASCFYDHTDTGKFRYNLYENGDPLVNIAFQG